MTRPASFDAAIPAYVPGLRKLAKRLRPESSRDDIDDMVQEALVRALASWRKYRTENSPYTWLKFFVRTISQEANDRAARHAQLAQALAGTSLEIALPNQEHAAELSLLAERMTPGLRGDILAIAQGAAYKEVAAPRNTSRQRIEQLIKQERARWSAAERRADARRDVAYGRV